VRKIIDKKENLIWKNVAFPYLVEVLDTVNLSNSWEILCNGNCAQDDGIKYQVHGYSNIFVITRRKAERII
jgi:hypothetical protein